MDEPTVLRTTKIGGGFVKEDVLTYLDELNSKISGLEDELKAARESGPSDSQEITKFRNQIDNLQEKLNQSNNLLRSTKKENEELQKQHDADQKLIAQLKAGGAGQGAAPANAQSQAALEAAKKEIDKLRGELKAVTEKGGAPVQAAPNAQVTAALEAAKKEIDKLRNELKAANDKLAAADKKGGAPGASAGNPAAEAELVKAKQDIAKITADLEAKTAQLEAKIKESAEAEAKIAKLTKDSADSAKKDEQIKDLTNEINELKANASNPAGMMGTLFAEAQKTVDQLKKTAEQEANQTTKEAKEKADKLVSDAQANADKTIKEANATAEKTINDANATADKTIKEANATADKTIKEANATAEMTVAKANSAAEKTVSDANAQAKSAVDDANSKADKINAMSSTVRLMLLNEIESVNSKFNEITASVAKLAEQATTKMSDAQVIVSEARKSVENSEKEIAKRLDAPKADFEPSKAPSGSTPKFDNKVADEAFARVSGGSYNNGNNNNNKPVHNNNNVQEAPKNAPKKNFAFDMSDLLKAAEEEAAKESE
ncbi:MAG: hypothetical protein J6P14_02755 [Ruminococcus sp.]|nr:hypothetical protein [Ruminococcus sp.]